MTVSSTVNRNDYVGNGATSVFSYGFRIFDQSHLLVTVRNNATAVETVLVLTTDFTVSGVGALAGGAISLVSNGQAWLTGGFLTSGFLLSVRRVPPITQLTDLRNQGSYYPENVEDELDKLIMTDQAQQDQIDRAMKLPETVTPGSVSGSLPVPAALLGLRWNAGASALENYTPGAGGVIALPGAPGIAVYAGGTNFINRSVAAGAGIAVTNGDGQSGNPTVAVATAGVTKAMLASDARDISIQSQSNNYAVVAGDDMVLCDATGGQFTVTLPAASGFKKPIIIKKIDSTFNFIQIAKTGSDTIDGSSGTRLYTQNESITLIASGTNWIIVRRDIVSAWTAYTPTLKGSTGDPGLGAGTASAFWRRVGDSIEVKFGIKSGAGATAGSGNFYVTLPAGLTVDQTKTPADGIVADGICGHGYVHCAGTVDGAIQIFDYQATGPGFFQIGGGTGSGSNINATNPAGNWFATAGNSISGQFKIAVTGWIG